MIKRKKEAKKEKHVGIWKTLRVSHIPIMTNKQTNKQQQLLIIFRN
jgi:hypothetical protein